MKIAIMQPYFFPYEGYFELIKKVDLFVFLDDVQYIRRGWINRNIIKVPNSKFLTIPVQKANQNSLIKDIKIFGNWVPKHIKLFKNFFGSKVLNNKVFEYYTTLEGWAQLSPMVCDTVQWMCRHMEIECKFDFSHNYPSEKKGKDRIIELCKHFGASEYFNLPNGSKIYSLQDFKNNDIQLNFIDTSKFECVSILQKYLL